MVYVSARSNPSLTVPNKLTLPSQVWNRTARRDPRAPSGVGSPPNGRTAHRQKCACSTKPTRGRLHVVRVLGRSLLTRDLNIWGRPGSEGYWS